MPEKLIYPIRKSSEKSVNNIRIRDYLVQSFHKADGKAHDGAYFLKNELMESDMSIEEFKRDSSIIERIDTESEIDVKIESIWTSIKYRSQMGEKHKNVDLKYATDIEGSLMDDTVKRWNINKFTPYQSLIHRMPHDEWMGGIHYSYLYVGTNATVFPFHVEDYNLNAINYLHLGSPKIWYGIAEQHRAAFEEFCKPLFPEVYGKCNAPLRHRTLLLDRNALNEFEFNVTEAVHRENQIIISWGGAYHAHFNTGFNISEAVNFASSEWYTVGRTYENCNCP